MKTLKDMRALKRLVSLVTIVTDDGTTLEDIKRLTDEVKEVHELCLNERETIEPECHNTYTGAICAVMAVMAEISLLRAYEAQARAEKRVSN